MNRDFSVAESSAGTRLDVYVGESCDIARTEAQRLIDGEFVHVNGKLKKSSYRVQTGDAVAVQYAATRVEELVQREVPHVRIVYEGAEYIVIDKPAGLIAHPVKSWDEPSVIGQILQMYPEIKEVGEVGQDQEGLRPGIVHRLDRDVSGVMLIARTQAAFDELKRLFASREMHKVYAAVVYGELEEGEKVVDFPISRSTTFGRRMAAKTHEQGGTEAITRILRLAIGRNRTLVKCEPETGRMNQIRVHLSALDHPIVGERVYVPKKWKKEDKGRIYLHAARISFDFHGEKVSYASTLPPEFTQEIEANAEQLAQIQSALYS